MTYLQFVLQKHLREFREYIYNISILKLRGGTNQPDSHFTKRKRIFELQRNYNYDIFFESGTFYGSMISVIKKNFKRCYSVEIFEPLAVHNIRYFKKLNNIKIMMGDSSTIIKDIISKEIDNTFLFWLDGHYSGSGTGLGKEISPILTELNSIFCHDLKSYTIIIDDWRLFDGIDYPSKSNVLDLIKSFDSLNLNIFEDKDALIITR